MEDDSIYQDAGMYAKNGLDIWGLRLVTARKLGIRLGDL